ncbi:MAG: D-alanyl-D-alanine endopeptidase [Pseudomonadales bacterium]
MYKSSASREKIGVTSRGSPVLKPHRLACLLLSLCLAVPTLASEVQLASVHAAVGNLETGKLLYIKNADRAVPIASVTKLMMAMVVLDARQPMDEWLPILGWLEKTGKNAYSRLRVGSQSRRDQLLKIALMSSENLAAHTLARYYPGGFDAFVSAMNAKARSLGMTTATFDDPTGLSLGNQASATDLWKMLAAAWHYDLIRAYSTTYQYQARFRGPRYSLGYGNTNPLTASSRWDVQLSKTGYLKESGRCLVMATDVDGEPIGMVFLNSFGTRTPLGDAGRTRRWLTNGDTGHVAGAALDYERQTVRTLYGSADD